MIPSNFSQGYNSAGFNHFLANGPNAFAYKIGTVDKIGQLMTNIPTAPGNIFKVNMLIGDLRIFNPNQPANTGDITIMPWDGGQFLMDDLKTPTPEQVITIKPSTYWSDITFNVSFTKASKVYFTFGTNTTDTVAIQKVTITPLNTSIKESNTAAAPTSADIWESGSQVVPQIRDELLGWLFNGGAANFTVNNFLRDPRGHQNWGAALAKLKDLPGGFNQIKNKPAILAEMLSVDKSNPANTLTDKQKLWFKTNFV